MRSPWSHPFSVLTLCPTLTLTLKLLYFLYVFNISFITILFTTYFTYHYVHNTVQYSCKYVSYSYTLSQWDTGNSKMYLINFITYNFTYNTWNNEKHVISRNILRTYSLKIQSYTTYFLYLIHVNAFIDPPWDLCQRADRIKVYLHYLWSINSVNTLGIIFQHFEFIVPKVIPKMVLGSPQHQCWEHNHVLPLSCDRVHHKGSLNRTKVVLFCKLCFITHMWPLINMKFISKINKNDMNLSKFFWLHHKLGWPHGINVYPSPFNQHKVTLNTFSSRMKSTPRVEVY